MTRYVIAADGGNSKTDLVLASVEGVILSRVAGAGIPPVRVGDKGTPQALAALARSAIAEAALPGDVAIEVGAFYLANVDFPDEEAAMYTALVAAGVAERLEVRNDTFAVLQAGSRDGWGIAVVAGAGINAAGRYPDGREERFLGIGPMSGDWGGGRAVARAALGAAVRAADGRGPATALQQLIVDAVGGTDIDAVAIAADRGVITDTHMYALAPTVFRAATDGDPVAVEIVHRLADEVLDFIRALLRRMELAASAVDVVLGGGTLQSGNPVLLNRIRTGLAELAPLAELRILDLAPVAGALVSALRLAGAEPDAIARGREALRV